MPRQDAGDSPAAQKAIRCRGQKSIGDQIGKEEAADHEQVRRLLYLQTVVKLLGVCGRGKQVDLQLPVSGPAGDLAAQSLGKRTLIGEQQPQISDRHRGVSRSLKNRQIGQAGP